MDGEKKFQKPAPRPRPIISFILRVFQVCEALSGVRAHAVGPCLAVSSNAPTNQPEHLPQIAFCVICLATSSNWARTWQPYRTTSFQVYLILQSVNLAIFSSVSGALLSTFLLLAPRLVPRIAE